MGMLRVERITPYIIDTLKRTVTVMHHFGAPPTTCLTIVSKDPHPYVRKTVALCIAKIILFQLDGAASDGLISCLKEMLNDKSPAVHVLSPKNAPLP